MTPNVKRYYDFEKKDMMHVPTCTLDEYYSAGEYLRLQDKVPKGMISLFNKNHIEDHYLQSN